MNLQDRVAIVTGGASGFGEGIARRFAAEGAHVVIADLNGEAAEKLAGEIGGLAVKADVSRGADVKALVRAARDRFGDIDILVNNAGIGHKPQPLDALSEEDFDRIVAVNAKSMFLTAREIVPLMTDDEIHEAGRLAGRISDADLLVTQRLEAADGARAAGDQP